MGLDFEYIDGQTPLDNEETSELLIPTISTRGELDEFEQKNIEQAVQWILTRSFKPETVFNEYFIRTVHKRMFGEVWAWAGEFRKTNKNIGIDKWGIPTQLKGLLDDALYWYNNGTYPNDEMAIRFKHRIVSIHCFPNGNGRHSRIMADIIITKLFKEDGFSWGAGNLVKKGNAREAYLHAIKEADAGNIHPLLIFSRS